MVIANHPRSLPLTVKMTTPSLRDLPASPMTPHGTHGQPHASPEAHLGLGPHSRPWANRGYAPPQLAKAPRWSAHSTHGQLVRTEQ